MADIVLSHGQAIHIGPATYTVICCPSATRELTRDGNAGLCDFRRLELQFAEDIPYGRRLRTVLHELIHAAGYEYLRADELSEAQVDAVAGGLAQVLEQLGITIVAVHEAGMPADA